MRTVTVLRSRPAAGTIGALLDIVGSELRFYQQIAPHVGVRVPAFVSATSTHDSTTLVLEDTSEWPPAGDPATVAATLSELHGRWAGIAAERWPWLRPPGAAADAIGAAYDHSWPAVEARSDLTSRVRQVAAGLRGRIAYAERAEAGDGPLTLVNGNATINTVRIAGGQPAFTEWLDVRVTTGVAELLWYLVSSVPRDVWTMTMDAYGPAPHRHIVAAAPAVAGQAIFAIADLEDGSEAARGWIERLDTLIDLAPSLATLT